LNQLQHLWHLKVSFAHSGPSDAVPRAAAQEPPRPSTHQPDRTDHRPIQLPRIPPEVPASENRQTQNMFISRPDGDA
jgi:hypothetical protein